MNSVSLSYVLQKYRAQSELTLEQVSAKISLPKSLIRSLENQSYRTSSDEHKEALKRLCYLYGLQYSEVEKLYLEGCSEPRFLFQPKSLSRILKNFSITDRTIRFAILCIGFTGIGGYLSLQGYTFIRSPKVVLAQLDDFQYVSESKITISGRVDTGGNLTLNGESVTLESDGQFSIDVPLRQGQNPLEFNVQRGQSEPSIVQKIVYLK